LLGFARRNHSASPEPSRLILSFNEPTATWRFYLRLHQHSILARGSQHPSSISTQDKSFASIKFKISEPDSCVLPFNRNLTPSITRHAFNLETTQALDNILADSRSGACRCWAATQRRDHAERKTLVAREGHPQPGNRNTPAPVALNRVGRQGRRSPRTPAAAPPSGDRAGGHASHAPAHLGSSHSEKPPAELSPRLRPP
jgi:hypothetical protein